MHAEIEAVLRGERRWCVVEGDNRSTLAGVADNSIDAVVTDAPYELGFMGKRWDASGIAYSVDLWRAVLRVLKPGGHLLAFGGTRTYHRMTCAIEDAGFEVRDSLHWMYGTGFPKSLNLGDGRGTALKPGHEPIVLARKPLVGTVAANVEVHGTGALNIDGCRISTVESLNSGAYAKSTSYDDASSPAMNAGLRNSIAKEFVQPVGRWPANVLLDEDAAAELDEQSGTLISGAWNGQLTGGAGPVGHLAGKKLRPMVRPSDSGGASRFFYVAKPSRAERDFGCESLPVRSAGEATDREDGTAGLNNPRAGAGRTGGARNFHPTVKPIELMRYLVRLVTPPGGVVLDPFTGSGTTGCGVALEGARFIGCELSAEYVEIANARISAAEAMRAGDLAAANETPRQTSIFDLAPVARTHVADRKVSPGPEERKP